MVLIEIGAVIHKSHELPCVPQEKPAGSYGGVPTGLLPLNSKYNCPGVAVWNFTPMELATPSP